MIKRHGETAGRSMGKAGRVLILFAAAAGLAALTIWLISIGDDYHRDHPWVRQGNGRFLFMVQVALSLLPAYLGWQCLRGAWSLMTAPSYVPPPPQPAPSPPEPAPLSEDEQYAAAASEAWDRRRDEADAAYHSQSDAVAEAHEKLARAKQLVDKSDVGVASMEILRIAWHWPSWSKRDDWQTPFEIEGLDTFDGHGIAWKWQGFEFGLKLMKHPNYISYDKNYGDIVVHANGEQVLKLDVSSDMADEYDRWSYHGVSGLVPGPWMAALVDFAGALRLSETKRQRDWQDKYYTDKAAGIRLPEREDE
jgi:hypothetical protein